MSHSSATKNRAAKTKKRKLIHRTATRKTAVCETQPQDAYDDETFSTLAAMEWLTFDEETKDTLIGYGVFDSEEYIDCRVGMRHASPGDFFAWASLHSLGHVRDQAELKKFIALQLFALEVASANEAQQDGFNVLADIVAATRHKSISPTIRSHRLPSGANYCFSPYEMGSREHAMWLLKCGRKYLKN